MIIEQVLGAVERGATYGQVARRYGISRGKVSGIVWRSRNSYQRIAPKDWKPREPKAAPITMAVLDVMADGRLRTVQDVVDTTGLRWNQAHAALWRLFKAGVMKRIPLGEQNVGWQEIDE